MKKSDINYILCSVFAAMTAFFYCCTAWFHIQLPRYYPLERTWKWIKEQGVPSQAWYAKQIFAFLTAGIVTVIVYFILRRNANIDTSLRPSVIKITGVLVSWILIICMGYILYYEFDKWGVFTAMGL